MIFIRPWPSVVISPELSSVFVMLMIWGYVQSISLASIDEYQTLSFFANDARAKTGFLLKKNPSNMPSPINYGLYNVKDVFKALYAKQ